jgi:hypothetical protein
LLVLLRPCPRRSFKPKQMTSALPASSSVCRKLLIVLARLHARSVCVRFCLCSFAYARQQVCVALPAARPVQNRANLSHMRSLAPCL